MNKLLVLSITSYDPFEDEAMMTWRVMQSMSVLKYLREDIEEPVLLERIMYYMVRLSWNGR